MVMALASWADAPCSATMERYKAGDRSSHKIISVSIAVTPVKVTQILWT